MLDLGPDELERQVAAEQIEVDQVQTRRPIGDDGDVQPFDAALA